MFNLEETDQWHLRAIAQLATDGVKEFVYNVKTLQKAKGVAVLSFVKGKSGTLDPDKLDLVKGGISTAEATAWEAFDAGIACQTFCLAAHAKGVGLRLRRRPARQTDTAQRSWRYSPVYLAGASERV